MTKRLDRFSRGVAALAAALMLAACGGGGGGASAPSVPQVQALPVVGKILATMSGTPVVGSSGTYTLSIIAQTAAGVPISGLYATPITLSNSDTSGATRLSATSVPSSTTVVSLVYNGAGGSPLGGFNGATITATSGSITGQVTFLASRSACVTIRAIGGYYPCDLQSAYSLPSSTAGTGETVAVVDAYGDPNAESDLGTYRAEFGLPACTTANGCFSKVNQRGANNSPPLRDYSGWSVEESLDLDMVSAVCPNCHILMVEADTNNNIDMYASIDEAIALGATQVSNSWGGPEDPSQLTEDPHLNHPGVNIVASSGDSDYGVSYPASSPYVTSVGGTNLSYASTARGWGEFVWNNYNVQGAGSGCSSIEPKPVWQIDTGCANRTDNDVAAVGDPYTGVAFYDTFIVSGHTLGGWAITGGTSVGAPIIAAAYALAGSAAASLNAGSYSYSHLDGFNDITNGANGTCAATTLYLCTAEVGYDGPTGNGTPIGIGGFGGPALAPASRARQTMSTVRRHVLDVAPGGPTARACQNPQPGHASCDAIMVVPK